MTAHTTLVGDVLAPPARSHLAESLRVCFHLARREVRTVLRTPVVVLPSILVPVIFFFVMVGSLEGFAGRSGLANYKAFEVPMVILFAVTGAAPV